MFLCFRPFLFKKGYTYVSDKQTETLSSLTDESLFLTLQSLDIGLPYSDSGI